MGLHLRTNEQGASPNIMIGSVNLGKFGIRRSCYGIVFDGYLVVIPRIITEPNRHTMKKNQGGVRGSLGLELPWEIISDA